MFVRIIRSIVFATTLFCHSHVSIAFSNHDEVSNMMFEYRTNSDPVKLVQLMKYFDKNQLVYETSSSYSVIAFLSGAFHTHAGIGLDRWIDFANGFDEPSKSAFLAAVNNSPDQLMSKMPVSPIQNEVMWGLYFSTGEEAFLEKLFSNVFLEGVKGDENALNLEITRMSARWSLATLSSKDEYVFRYLAKERDYGVRGRREVAEYLLKVNPESIPGLFQTRIERLLKGGL
ncbi:hypothetical protein [Endozoicomonas sp. ALC066]|uniref:hypothetical protein n=1 Tax=Endozoicomonas sp. ALC066 TaxID=3403078 RepID=UPI003BB507AF